MQHYLKLREQTKVLPKKSSESLSRIESKKSSVAPKNYVTLDENYETIKVIDLKSRNNNKVGTKWGSQGNKQRSPFKAITKT